MRLTVELLTKWHLSMLKQIKMLTGLITGIIEASAFSSAMCYFQKWFKG